MWARSPAAERIRAGHSPSRPTGSRRCRPAQAGLQVLNRQAKPVWRTQPGLSLPRCRRAARTAGIRSTSGLVETTRAGMALFQARSNPPCDPARSLSLVVSTGLPRRVRLIQVNVSRLFDPRITRRDRAAARDGFRRTLSIVLNCPSRTSRPEHTSMNWSRSYGLRSYLRSSLWVVPFIAIPLELVVTRLSHGFDSWLGWNFLEFPLPGAQPW